MFGKGSVVGEEKSLGRERRGGDALLVGRINLEGLGGVRKCIEGWMAGWLV